MALSRRKFTKEVKLAAIQRLDAGASAAEVARAFEVTPKLLHRWRKEFRQGPGNAFPRPGQAEYADVVVGFVLAVACLLSYWDPTLPVMTQK